MNWNIVIAWILLLSIVTFLVVRLIHAAQPYALIFNQNGEYRKIDLKIADTPRKRANGLMHQTHLPENAGMLFVFQKPGKQTFWMKDTLIPLDMIVLSPELQIVDIKTNLTPKSEEIIISHAISAWIIEVNSGYCERNHVVIGDRVSLHRWGAFSSVPLPRIR